MKPSALFLALLLSAFFGCVNQEPDDSALEAETKSGPKTESVPTPVAKLTGEIRENPGDPELYLQRANAHIHESMLLLAMDDVNRALALDSMDARYHALKGEVQYLAKDPSEAVKSFERALELDPENTDALLKMAEIKLLLRQYQDCFDLANKALRVNEQLYMAYFIKGYAHYELGDSSRFVSSVQTALELNPDFYDGYTMLGSFYASLGNDIALDYYNSALEVRPDDGEALYGKAIYLQNNGRPDEAMTVYDYMVSLEDTNPLPWYNQGYIWLEVKNEPERAITYFERALEIFPEYPEALYNLGLCYERMGQTVKARGHYSEALKINPEFDLAAEGLERLR